MEEEQIQPIQFIKIEPDNEYEYPIHRGPLYHCTLCGTAFINLYFLGKHRDKCTQERIFRIKKDKIQFEEKEKKKQRIAHLMKCLDCNLEFTKFTDMRFHKINHKRIIYICTICKKVFINYSQYISHIRSHTGERPFKCTICNRDFARKYLLTRHNMIHLKKEYKCDICSKEFTYSFNLKEHRLTHTGEKPFQCKICKKTFTKSSQLKSHRQKRNKCQYYLKDYNPNHNYSEDDEQYKCLICDKKFDDMSILKRHNLMHNQEKFYQCEVCNKEFLYPSSLNRHKLIHSDHKQFKCDICEIEFTLPYNLKRHKTKHHPEMHT